jgi:membrane fusion protein, multidrug efflux system
LAVKLRADTDDFFSYSRVRSTSSCGIALSPSTQRGRRRRWCSPSSYEHLEQTGYGSVQNAQQYTSQLHQQQAALASAQATVKPAQRQVEALKAQRNSAVASLGQAEAQRDQAKLNLSYTKILAPVDGMIAQRSVQVGNYVSVGGALMAVVPLSEVYIEANYREVQLGHVRAR